MVNAVVWLFPSRRAALGPAPVGAAHELLERPAPSEDAEDGDRGEACVGERAEPIERPRVDVDAVEARMPRECVRDRVVEPEVAKADVLEAAVLDAKKLASLHAPC